MLNPHVLFLNKEVGITSHKAILQVKKLLHCNTIGHCGTLDKFASGLLIVLLNKATRLSQFFLKLPKSYTAEIYFGKTTDTLDSEGIQSQSTRVPRLDEIEMVLSKYFTGTIIQRPPDYSAIHIDGQRAYKRKRRGEQFTITSRTVHIFSYAVLDYSPPLLKIKLRVSSGTYIRAIARDLAFYCNSLAYVYSLVRDRIADFTIEQSCSFATLSSSFNTVYLNTISRAPSPIQHYIVSPDLALESIHGLSRYYTDNESIRDRVARGQLPEKIYEAIFVANTDFFSVHDAKGVIGIWKKTPKCKLIFHT